MAKFCFLASYGLFLIALIHGGRISSAAKTQDGLEEWGYVEVRPKAHMFWWHYKSPNRAQDPSKPWPTILWLQGGPVSVNHVIRSGADLRVYKDKSTKGFSKSYKNFHFYWIFGAGHYVPKEQPCTALLMVTAITQTKMIEDVEIIYSTYDVIVMEYNKMIMMYKTPSSMSLHHMQYLIIIFNNILSFLVLFRWNHRQNAEALQEQQRNTSSILSVSHGKISAFTKNND